jgi:hypothetical protein
MDEVHEDELADDGGEAQERQPVPHLTHHIVVVAVQQYRDFLQRGTARVQEEMHISKKLHRVVYF